MKGSVCRKKKEKLYCQACSTRPVSLLQISPLTRKIDSLKQTLENEVGKTLHLYFDSQEKREKELELKQLNNTMLQMKDMRTVQEEKIIKLVGKRQQKILGIETSVVYLKYTFKFKQVFRKSLQHKISCT